MEDYWVLYMILIVGIGLACSGCEVANQVADSAADKLVPPSPPTSQPSSPSSPTPDPSLLLEFGPVGAAAFLVLAGWGIYRRSQSKKVVK